MIFYYRHISIFLPFRHLRFLQTNVHHTNVVLLLYNFESPDPPNCRLPKFLGDSSLFLSNHNPMKIHPIIFIRRHGSNSCWCRKLRSGDDSRDIRDEIDIRMSCSVQRRTPKRRQPFFRLSAFLNISRFY